MKSQHKANSKTVSKSTPSGKSGKPGSASIQQAKKAVAVKKKSAPLSAKKAAPVAPKKAVPAKPARASAKPVPAAVKKAAPAQVASKKAGAKPDLKDLKKKPMAAPAAKQAAQHAASKDDKKKSAPQPAPVGLKKAPEKSAEKVAEKVADKSSDRAVKAPEKTAEKMPQNKVEVEVETGSGESLQASEVAEKPSTLAGKSEKVGRKAKDDGMTFDEAKPEAEIVLTDAEGRRYCRVKDCDQIALVDSYCRYHYLLFWKNIQVRKKILSEGKLERYIEELTARYPDKYLDMLRKDLRNEKDFQAAIQELEIDEASVDNEYEDEAQSYLEEVRGMSSEGGSAREEEDF